MISIKFYILRPKTTKLAYNSRAHTCQSKRMRGDARQNEGVRIKDLFPAQNHSAKSLVVSELPNPLKLHYANKFHKL